MNRRDFLLMSAVTLTAKAMGVPIMTACQNPPPPICPPLYPAGTLVLQLVRDGVVKSSRAMPIIGYWNLNDFPDFREGDMLQAVVVDHDGSRSITATLDGADGMTEETTPDA